METKRDTKRETLIVFDGNSLLNRAFYGVRPLSNQAGLPTNAVFGFVNILQKALSSVEGGKPTYAAMTFDLREPTFRHKACAFYKANRKGMPEELAVQLPYARKVAQAMGLRVCELAGFEADDLIGTLSAAFASRGTDCILVTGDRDSYQLVGEHVTVHLAANHETRVIDADALRQLYGVSPRQMIEVKSIMGDASDNIPGVAGIGEKGALKLIAQYGDLEGVYAHIDEIKGSTHDKLLAGKESAYTSRFLAEIRLDAPIDTQPEAYRYQGADVNALRALYAELEFRKLSEQLPEEEQPEADGLPQAPTEISANAADIRSKTVAVYPKEQSLAVSDGETLYAVPWEQAGELFDAERTVVLWSLKELLHALWAHGLEEFPCQAVDLSLLAYLSAPTDNGISFDKTVFRCLGENVPQEPQVHLFFLLRERLQASMTDAMRRLYTDMELPLARVLAEMERVGFCLDTEQLQAFTEQLGQEIAVCEQEIYALAGRPFNLNSTKQLGEVLFEERGLPHYKKTKSGYSTDAETLEKLSYDPLVQRLLDYRKAAKLKSTYGDGLLKVVSADGRVHTTFKQTMTQTGRLSSAEPNLQNIPVRTEKGRQLRRFFVAKEGWLLVDADYSQIELRLLAHISGDEALIQAFRSGADIHTATAAQVFGVSEQNVTPQMRKSAKAVNFGIIYGIGKYSLSQDLGISVREADAYIQSYFAKYPKIRSYMEQTKAFAAEHLYVETLFGRRREIPELGQKNKVRYAFGERVAMNTPIQGTAADLIKFAMIRVSDALKKENLRARLVLQIHDELIVEAPKDEVERVRTLLEREMEHIVTLAVPLVAQAKVGASWYDCKD